MVVPDFKLLAPVALKWRNQNPQLYDEFLKRLDRCVFDVTVAVTEAPSDQILQAQGRAQMARKFMQVFAETMAPSAQSNAASQ